MVEREAALGHGPGQPLDRSGLTFSMAYAAPTHPCVMGFSLVNVYRGFELHRHPDITKGLKAPLVCLAEREAALGPGPGQSLDRSGLTFSMAYAAPTHPCVMGFSLVNVYRGFELHRHPDITKGLKAPLVCLAEREGFEPSMGF